jgi:TonB family protein
MSNMRERLGLGWPISWRAHIIVLALMAVVYGGIFYVVAQVRAPLDSSAKGPPMFIPVVATSGPQRGGIATAEHARPGQETREAQDDTPPPRHWVFPPIDLMPSAPGWVASVTDLTPVTDAKPDPSETPAPLPEDPAASEAALERSNLRLVRWLRPVYASTHCGLLRTHDPLVLDLRIEPGGQPVEIKIAQGSGSTQLDKTVLHAAGLWRFAPPEWKSQPIEVSARVELRFNC